MTDPIRALLRLLAWATLAWLSMWQVAAAAPPADSVRIHFHRSNHDYTGWGLHVWGDDVRPPRVVTWAQPLEPAGVDGFGVYFDVPVAPGTRNVPFILHRGDTKNVVEDQMLNLAQHGREVWVLENSSTLFTVRPSTESDFELGAQAQQSSQRTTQLVSAGVTLAVLALVAAWLVSQRRLSSTRQQLARQVELLVEAQRELKQQGERVQRGLDDELTGLPTRTALQQALDRALGRCKREQAQLAVLFIDLDGFKQVNDSAGHDAGDHVLRTVAERFRATLRDSDMVARVGGDEFVAVIENLHTPHHAFKVGRKLTQTASAPIVNGERMHQVSASVGVAVYPGDGADGATLMKNADSAMYDAKKAGKNACRFHRPELQQAAEERLHLEQGLRDALARYELLLHYRPEVSLATGEVVGLEAQLRWTRGGELQPPHEVFELAQDAGMLEALDRWTLLEASRQLQAWHVAGRVLRPVTVTLSGLPPQEGDLVPPWAQVPDVALKPRVQFTTQALTDRRFPMAGLQALHRWGVPVSLLQSGMQAVELMPLVEARPAVLKLSAEWLHASQDGDGPYARAVKALAAVGAAQGFVLAVEGVDTAGLREVAARLGCRQAQGALFDGAVPAAEAERWLA